MGDDFKDILAEFQWMLLPWYHPARLLEIAFGILCLPFLALEFFSRGALKFLRFLADRILSN